MSPTSARGARFAIVVGAVVFGGLNAGAAQTGAVEVIEVSGIIDGSVERSVIGGIDAAEHEGAALVVLQIDSRGAVGSGRAQRVADRVQAATVPVVTWIGPSGTRAEHGAAMLALAGHMRSIAPGSVLGPMATLNLSASSSPSEVLGALEELDKKAGILAERSLSAAQAVRAEVIDVIAPSLAEVLRVIDGERIHVGDRDVRVSTDPDRSTIRFHKLDLLGRVLHAAAQPSITYLLLLLGLVGIVFETFHPSTGPAGIAGLAGLALASYGVVVLGGSWLGFGLMVAGVGGFVVDLRFQSLGPLTVAGLAGLVAGSLLLFRGPWLRPSWGILVLGIAGMVAFLLGAMTRVLRDLRAVARGELEVRDTHPPATSPDEQGGH